MKFDNYKTIKKTEWQDIATQFEIEWNENSVVRYLVEKIAEKIGVDEKIVSDNELKKQVVNKINSDFEVVPLEEPAKEVSKKSTAKKSTAKKVSKPKETVIAKVESEKKEIISTEEVIVETPVIELTRLQQLRLECEAYGIAWSEGLTEVNLEQVLNGVKSAGVQPMKEVATSITPVSQAINTNEAFEINSSNAVDVAQAVSNTQMTNPAFNPLATPPPPLVNGGYQNSNSYLDTYKNIFLNTIRGHWRLLSVAEINEMILRDTQTFTHQVNLHPQQQNKAEIILTQGEFSVRIPSDNTNDWLDING